MPPEKTLLFRVQAANSSGEQIRAIDSWLEDDIHAREKLDSGTMGSRGFVGFCNCSVRFLSTALYKGLYGVGF